MKTKNATLDFENETVHQQEIPDILNAIYQEINPKKNEQKPNPE